MRNKLSELAIAFLKLGMIAFGGPAAAYGMMRQEFVSRRNWVTEEKFLDFLGIANLVPGPNATEMAILIGFHHAGWPGLIVGGVCYIGPAMVIVLALAWGYVQFGEIPELQGILYGIKPVVVAIIVSAMWAMLKPRVKQWFGMMIVVGVFVAYLAGISPLVLLLAGALLKMSFDYLQTAQVNLILSLAWLPLFLIPVKELMQRESYKLLQLFWVFLKAGALMFGSGYVLLAFIKDDLVVRLGWLTENQMIDAIAVGQVTPGPLSTTATFVGYVVGGVPTALLATLGMFLPSFLFVGLMYFVVNKIRESERFSGAIDGINYAALGLMAGVTWEIIGVALVDPFTFAIAIIALFLLLRYDLGATWLVLGAVLVGVARAFIGW